MNNLNNIAKFNPNRNSWTALPNQGLNGIVRALAAMGSDLNVGGDFATIDETIPNLGNIAKLSTTGNAWSALSQQGLDDGVNALAVIGGDLYVGGRFSCTGDCRLPPPTTKRRYLNHMARYSGGAWFGIPDPGLGNSGGGLFNGPVLALAVRGSDLYAGGGFTQTYDRTPEIFLGGVAKFSTVGNSWSTLPNQGLDGITQAFALNGSDLYVGGGINKTRDGTMRLPGIAQLSITSNAWSALPNNGLAGNVSSLAVFGTDLYVSGDFTQTADQKTLLRGMARYSLTNNTWSALPNKGLGGTGFGGQGVANAFAINGDDIYVGGNFARSFDGTVTNLNNIAKLTNDTDGDGLPDEWEREGVTIEDVFIDLPSMGADPLHKDLFIHADWMDRAGLKPDLRDLQIISDSFENASLANPDGTTGVHLHVDLGSDSVMNPVTGATWAALSKSGALPYQETIGTQVDREYNWTDTDHIKNAFFNPAKRGPVFHYVCFCGKLGGLGNMSGLSRGILAHDFLVSLGGWPVFGGTSLQKAGTFMHELGHNLGLHHGGGDEVNFKPNFLSVMNYGFQTIGLLTQSGNAILRNFDYSRLQLPTLDETALVESVGISDPEGHLTLWNTLQPNAAGRANPNDYYRVLAYPATDWSCNRALTPGTVQADLNRDGICIGPGRNGVLDTAPNGDDLVIGGSFIVDGANRKSETLHAGDDDQLQAVNFQQPNLLTSFDDWSIVRFDGGGQIGRLPTSPAVRSAARPSNANTTVVDETTSEQIKAFVPPTLASADAIDPSNAITSPANEATYEEIEAFVPSALLQAETTAPIDVVSYSPSNGPASLVVRFDGSASSTPIGSIISWIWYFGDGTVGSGSTIQHQYDVPGTYFATLRVANGNGDVSLLPLRHRVNVIGNTSSPRLAISRNGDTILISWTGSEFALQSAGSLIGPWKNETTGNNTFTTQATDAVKFFRLTRP